MGIFGTNFQYGNNFDLQNGMKNLQVIASSIARDRDDGNPFHCSYESSRLLSEFSSRKLNYF